MTTPSVTSAVPIPQASTGTTIRMERLVPVVVVIAVLLIVILTITPWPIGTYVDDAIYTVLGKALATGEGYRQINLPGAPYATHYPPGYPFVLSLLWRLVPAFPDNVVLFKFANAAFTAVAAGGIYAFARRRLGLGLSGAAAVALAGTASVMVIHLAGLVLSEPLFLALLFVALPTVERAADEGRLRDAIMAGVLLGALAMVRTLGAVVVGAAVLVLLWRRRPRAVIALVATAALFLVPWQLWVGAHQDQMPGLLVGKYGAYGPWLLDGYREGGLPFARDVLIQNLASVGNTLSFAVAPVNRAWPRIVGLAMLVPVFLVGLIALARRAPVLAAAFALYVAVILIWPFDPFRFLIAIWPVFVIVVASAWASLWRWTPRGRPGRVVRLVAFAATVGVVAGHAAHNWRGYTGQWWLGLQQVAGQSAKPLVEWVVTSTDPDDLLATEHDATVFLYTGRRGVPTSTFLARQRVRPFTPAETVMWVDSMLTAFRPRYFATGWPAHLAAADSLAARTPPVLRRVQNIPHHTVYELRAP